MSSPVLVRLRVPACLALAAAVLVGRPSLASAQLAATGKSLTVTTANAVATFAGPDLVGLVNSVTNETYLTLPSQGELVSLSTLGGSQPLQASNWTLGTEPGTGAAVATITAQNASGTLTLAVKIDAVRQEIVVKLSAATVMAGLRDAAWSLAGVDLTRGRIIVPANTGIMFDARDPGVGTLLQYPNSWHAQMAVYESPRGSLVLYSTDSSFAFKQLRIGTRGSSSVDVAIATEARAPFVSATAVPTIEWRLKAFAGDWRVAARPYRDWLLSARPPLSDSAHPWVSNIRTVVGIRNMDSSLLAPLAAKVVPAQTLLYVHDWRRDAYDVNYPDYTPRATAADFVNTAHAHGFKVMLHLDLIGVTPSNPDYSGVQTYQVRTPDTRALMGWKWDAPALPYRFAFISPAAAAYRSLFIDRVRAAVNALSPDALHLDISAPMYNDGNGLIEGLTYPAGSARLHEELIAAFPAIAFGGEGENDILYRYHSFAQAWYPGVWDPPFHHPYQGHPISTFLFDSKVRYYGHLGQPGVKDSKFKDDLLDLERRAVLPQLPVQAADDLDATNADVRRLLGIINEWQLYAFKPAWDADWTGVHVRYEGLSGASAQFTESPTLASLVSRGTTLLQMAHNVEQLTTPAFIPGWPAFDSTGIYGLDPGRNYYLDALPRAVTTHITSLPGGVRVDPGTTIGGSFAHIEVARVAASAFDFYRFFDAKLGVRFQGADTALGNGAVVSPGSFSAGGVARRGILMHPPWRGQIGGETFIEYNVPVAAGSALHFSVAMADFATCTDGVTLRVNVAGTDLWQRQVRRMEWRDADVDLSAYGGQTVALRLIAHPGPANNTDCDSTLWSQLELRVMPGAASVNVPVTLANGATVAGFDGDGALAVTSPQTVMVNNVPVPGEFTIFTQRGTAVSNGTNLASVPFDTWYAGRDEFAQPGRIFDAGSVGSATSAGVFKSPTIWAHPPFGRTLLTWVAHLPAAETLRLTWSAGLSDGSFSDDGVDFIVAINGVSYWQATARTTGWIPGAVDLSAWRDRDIVIELITDSRGNNGWDWANWADLVLTTSGTSCTYAVPPGTSVQPAGGSFQLAVGAPSTCPWRAVSSVPWLTLSNASGSGNGTVSYSVAPNPGGTRAGALTIAGQTFIVTQIATSLFTDDPLLPGASTIRAIHISELRSRIDALRAGQGLAPYPWSTPAPNPGVSVVRAVDIADLRAAVAAVYARLGKSLAFTDATLQPGIAIRAAHVNEIRRAVLAVE